MRVPAILFFLFLVGTAESKAQKVIVVSAKTGLPVENVALYNSSKTLSTLSDRSGMVDISIFEPTDSIHFQHPTYQLEVYAFDELDRVEARVYLFKKNIMMEEYVMSAARYRERKMEVPNSLDIIDVQNYPHFASLNTADLLLQTGNVMIQKTQGGAGSPILRGFEANKVLLIVDGVRLNNAIYRSGHLQNAITLDMGILDRVEVVYGPSSTIHGSDAIGGVIHYTTRNPATSGIKPHVINTNAYLQLASNNATSYHLDLNAGIRKFASLSSFTSNKFGDNRMGSRRGQHYPEDFGKRPFSVQQGINGDSLVSNPDPLVQKNTGYTQHDFLQKFLYTPTRNLDFLLNVQYSTSSNIDRYDELNRLVNGKPDYAEYYYGPQNRLLTSAEINFRNKNILFNSLNLLVAYQKIDEDRINRRFNRVQTLFQEEDVHAYSVNLHFTKFIKDLHRVNYGLEQVYNEVSSRGYYKNIQTGETSIAQSRYPDLGNYTNHVSAYAAVKWFISTPFIFTGGARYTRYSLYSRYSDIFDFLPYRKTSISNDALTGNLSLIYQPGYTFRMAAVASTGYRAPNVDDYGKVRAKDKLLTVPNNNLKPEYTYNIEINGSYFFHEYFRISGAFYYTYLDNAIVRGDFQVDGKDSLEYDGVMYKVISTMNAAHAEVKGLSASIESDPENSFYYKTTLNVTKGRDLTMDAPLSHIPPVFGRALAGYKYKTIDIQAFTDYHGWKYMKDMTPWGEDNPEQATSDGFPSWYTLNLKASVKISRNARAQFSVENILDRYYKVFASGISAPGRNFVLSLRVNI
jgi:hemoglobin/transferrin/lactoferrin receptor protein